MNNAQMEVEIAELKQKVSERGEYNDLKRQLRDLKYVDEILAYQKFKIAARSSWDQFLSWCAGFGTYWFNSDYYDERRYNRNGNHTIHRGYRRRRIP